MEHPLIELIMRSPEPVRIYALNGLALAFANEIEDTMFWTYLEASGQDWEAAGRQFYAQTKFSSKQDKTDAAVKARLANNVDGWRDLNHRIQSLLGEGNNLRNLIGHNPVTVNVWKRDSAPEEIIIAQTVSQKRPMVELRNRKAAEVGTADMAAYCKQLIELFSDLETFLSDVIGYDATRRVRYSRVW